MSMKPLTREQKKDLQESVGFAIAVLIGASMAIVWDWSWVSVLGMAVLYVVLFAVRIFVTKLWNGRKVKVTLTEKEVARVFSGIGDSAVAGDRAVAWEIMRDKQRELDRKKR